MERQIVRRESRGYCDSEFEIESSAEVSMKKRVRKSKTGRERREFRE